MEILKWIILWFGMLSFWIQTYSNLGLNNIQIHHCRCFHKIERYLQCFLPHLKKVSSYIHDLLKERINKMWPTNDSLVWHVHLVDSISPRLFLPNYIHKYAEKLVDMPNSDNLWVSKVTILKRKQKFCLKSKVFLCTNCSDAIYYSHLFLLFVQGMYNVWTDSKLAKDEQDF